MPSVFVVKQLCPHSLQMREMSWCYLLVCQLSVSYDLSWIVQFCQGQHHLSYMPSRDKNKSSSQTAVPKCHAKVSGSPMHVFTDKFPKH